MKRDMFEDVVTPSVQVGQRQWYSVPLSLMSHLVLVAVLVVAPLTVSGVLPSPQVVLMFAAPPPPPASPPPPVVEVAPPVVANRPAEPPNAEAAPLSAPDRITDEPPPSITAPTARLHAVVSPEGAGLLHTARVVLETPPPARPLPVGGAVREPRKLHHVVPVYPSIARAARREGTVILEATIARDGRVTGARVLRSSGMFDQAAIDAVRQWRYTTPTLNGMPIDVTMTVTVQFTLH